MSKLNTLTKEWLAQREYTEDGKRVGKARGPSDREAHIVGVDQVKGMVQRSLNIMEPGKPGYCHFPAGERCGVEYFRQLTAEKKVTEKQTRAASSTASGNSSKDGAMRLSIVACTRLLRGRSCDLTTGSSHFSCTTRNKPQSRAKSTLALLRVNQKPRPS